MFPNYNLKKNSRQVNVNKICGGGGYFYLEIISLWGGGTLPKKVTILPNTYEKLHGQSDKQNVGNVRSDDRYSIPCVIN